MKDKAKEPERVASASSSAKSLNEAVERSKGKKNTNETKAKVQLPAPKKAPKAVPKTLPKAVPKTAPKEAEMKIHVQKNGTRRFDTLQVSPSNQILDVLQQYLQVRVR